MLHNMLKISNCQQSIEKIQKNIVFPASPNYFVCTVLPSQVPDHASSQTAQTHTVKRLADILFRLCSITLKIILGTNTHKKP